MNNFLYDLGVNIPIIQAPMAGGATTIELVTAVSNAGALGSLAGGMLSPSAIIKQANAIKSLTTRPFMINLFVLSEHQSMIFDAPPPLWIMELYKSLGLEFTQPTQAAELFNEQFSALLTANPKVASFAFGILNQQQIQALKSRNIKIIGTVNHPQEAIAWQEIGADAICVQGSEAGGHLGGFLEISANNPTKLRSLLKQCALATNLPIIAAGGLMNGNNLADIIANGACAGQFGTAFLTTKESGIAPAYKDKLLNAQKDTLTRHTKLFSGKSARGIVNKFMEDYANFENNVPPYPQQNAYTQPIRKLANQKQDAEYMSLWAGEGLAHCRELTATELISELLQEYYHAIGK